MSGYMVLHISDNSIFKISHLLFNNKKTVAKLTNKDILQAFIYYDTYNRKPSSLLLIDFDRLKIDSDSNIIYSESEVYSDYLIRHIIFSEKSPQLEKNIPLPRAPIIPNDIEKRLLYKFLNDNFPMLAEDCPYYVESYIKDKIRIHNKNKKIVKESYCIK